LGASASTPAPATPRAAVAPPPVRHEVVDPADAAARAWLCGLLAGGKADLYAQDEADLALLPTLTRSWMARGDQLRVRAPGTNEKRSVSAATDLAEGAVLWRTDQKRCADQFCATLAACAERSTARGRLAVLLVDNAPGHKVGKTGIVRTALDGLAGRVALAFLPKYSPHLQPAERLWRQWRPNVTHNHTRDRIADPVADSDDWLARIAADPTAVRRAIALPTFIQPTLQAA
jgi:hypothetical protein